MSGNGFAPVVPGRKLVFPGRSRSASGLSHRVVVRDGQSHRPSRIGLRRAVDVVPTGHGARARKVKAGPISRYGWDTRRSPAPIPIASAKPSRAAASDRRASKPRPFHAWIDAWQMRGREGMNSDDYFAARTQCGRHRFRLRPAASKPTTLWCCRATPATA